MIASLKTSEDTFTNRWWHWLILPVYAVVIFITLKSYIQSGAINFQLGLVA